MLLQLTLDAIKRLDSGKAHEAFMRHLKRAADDCYDRPGDNSARKITLTFALTPVQDQDGSCNEVHAQIEVTSRVPAHRTKIYSMGLRPNGSLLFNEDSPESIDQMTMLADGDDE